MKHVSILIPNGQYSIVNIAGTLQIMEAANEMALQQSGKKLFEIELVAAKNPARDQQSLYLVNPSKTIDEVRKTDLIIVPAVQETHSIPLGLKCSFSLGKCFVNSDCVFTYR